MNPNPPPAIAILFEERRITLLLASLMASRGMQVISARNPNDCCGCTHVITEPCFLSAFPHTPCLVICPPEYTPAEAGHHPQCVILNQPLTEARVEKALLKFLQSAAGQFIGRTLQ